MARIIPAILTKDIKELTSLVSCLAPLTSLIHLDITDGIFVPEKTIINTTEIQHVHIPVNFEVHLMATDPEDIIDSWMKIGASRIIFHVEASKNPGLVIERIKHYDRKVGLGINPPTKVQDFEDLFDLVDFVHLMSVTPGAQGRDFHENVFDKIAYLRKIKPKLNITVDGGINETNIARLVRAGAHDLIIGSAIVRQKNPKEALKRLQDILENSTVAL